MQEGESITEMFTRFTEIVNGLEGLGKIISQEDRVEKILDCLTKKWESKVNGIVEANDMSTYIIEECIGNLMAYEMKLLHK